MMYLADFNSFTNGLELRVNDFLKIFYQDILEFAFR